jgi:hypothetical protein
LWTSCADTPGTLCAGWGNSCGNGRGKYRSMLSSWANAVHRLCGRKTFRRNYGPEVHSPYPQQCGPRLWTGVVRKRLRRGSRGARIRACVRQTGRLSGGWQRPSTASRPTVGTWTRPASRHGSPPSGQWSARSTRNSPGWRQATTVIVCRYLFVSEAATHDDGGHSCCCGISNTAGRAGRCRGSTRRRSRCRRGR